MADVTAGAARYASVAEVRADVERAGGDASGLCGFGRCFCVKAAPGISGRKERGHWPRFQEADRNRRLLATAIAAFDSLESDAKDSNIRQTMGPAGAPLDLLPVTGGTFVSRRQICPACGPQAEKGPRSALDSQRTQTALQAIFRGRGRGPRRSRAR